MNIKISELITKGQVKVIFDQTLKLNTLRFDTGNHISIGLGDKQPDAKIVKKLALTLAKTANKFHLKSLFLPALEVDDFEFIVTREIVNNDYQIQKIGLEPSTANTLQEITFSTGKQALIDQALAVAQGMALTRTLGDMPSNVCTPDYLATTAQNLATEFGLSFEVLEQADMQTLGMEALLSVAKGSILPPKLISLSYTGNGEVKPIVLVGKGVTFDSGGISLKPGTAMDEMKYDMCGGASVLGVMRAVVQMKLAVNLVVLVPAVENMPAHNASKPGDVVKSMSGQTIEILNTDAEGRLILCDVLSYAKKFNPEVVIDVATLTGAIIIALGKHHSGLMSNNEQLAKDLIQAGIHTQDTLWQLPLDKEFDEQLDSNFADMANIGTREAGSITAGCFLARFTKDYPWAHLDIAGTAWVSGKNKGATGRSVPLLTQYILDAINRNDRFK